jgi:xylulokinase
MSLFVGLDVGTQSVKLLAYDPARRETVATFSEPLELISKDDGSREQHARWWLDALRNCFARLDPALRARVTAIGVSGQQHGFVPLDATGKVLAPAKLWCDTSTGIECDEIMVAAGGPARCIALAGNPILAGYTASKLPWTRKHRPEVYAALATILLPHDFVNFWQRTRIAILVPACHHWWRQTAALPLRHPSLPNSGCPAACASRPVAATT